MHLDIETPYPQRGHAEKVGQALSRFFAKDGLTFTYRALDTAHGGTLRIMQLHVLGGAVKAHGRESSKFEEMLRITALVQRLMRNKPLKSIQSDEFLFPTKGTSFFVPCSGDLHKITLLPNGRIRLHNHDLSCDRTMSALAGEQQSFPCIRVLDALAGRDDEYLSTFLKAKRSKQLRAHLRLVQVRRDMRRATKLLSAIQPYSNALCTLLHKANSMRNKT